MEDIRMMNRKATILVIDDEHGVRESFKMVLKDEYNVLLAEDGEKAIDMFTNSSVDLVLMDILLPDINGIDLLKKVKGIDPSPEIIMVTAVREIETAVQAIKLGAYDYVVKPFVVAEIVNLIQRALEKHDLMKEVTYLRTELERYSPSETIIGNDSKIQKIFELISAISESEGAVLIQGESGTGKELIARAIHNMSSRKEHPFMVINCAAIPSTLMESEIFGYNRGAFTGATKTSLGKLEIADKGTIFLDDVDTLDIGMQAKLLRVVQEKEFERLGSTKVIKIDVKFVAASNKDLTALISKGEFREDLFYRLNVFPIWVPPLRERRRDIPSLLSHFLDLHARNNGKAPKRFSEKAMKALMEYDWPGNVRELQNLVERLSTITKGLVIHLKDLSTLDVGKREITGMTLREAVNAFERQYISEILELVDGNRKGAAEALGIHRNTLLAKMNELGLKS